MSKKRVVVVAATALTAAGLAATGGYAAGHAAGEQADRPPVFDAASCHELAPPPDPLNVIGGNWPAMSVCPKYMSGAEGYGTFTDIHRLGDLSTMSPGAAVFWAGAAIEGTQRQITQIVTARGLSDPASARRDIAKVRAVMDEQLSRLANVAVGTPVAHTPDDLLPQLPTGPATR